MILEASPSKEVMYVSAVRVHVLVLSSLTLTVPTSVEIVVPFALMIAPSIEPLNVEPFVRFSVSSESSPTLIIPLNSFRQRSE